MITLEPPRRLVRQATPETDAFRACGLSRAALVRFLREARVAVGLRGPVAVLLSGDAAVRRLNRDFRGKDTATDVLSFPAAPEMVELHAGDLAVSLETAARQARAQGHSLQDEVKVLLLHGMLHLAGLDHEVDRGQMARREAELRLQLRLKHGLIERVGEQDKEDAKGQRRKVNAAKTKDTVTPRRQSRKAVAA